MKIRNALRSYGVISTMLLCMIGFILLHLGHRDLADVYKRQAGDTRSGKGVSGRRNHAV